MARESRAGDAPADDREAAPERPGPAARRARRRDTAQRVQQVASAIRHRDELLAAALDMIHGAGFIDDSVRARVWDVYQQGDARTRVFIQELVARVLKVPYERMDEVVQSGRIDEVSAETLQRLESLTVPRVDVAGVAERVRAFDADRWLQKGSKSKVARFVGDLPVRANNLRRGLVLVGVGLVMLGGAALAFPAVAEELVLYGFIGLLIVTGALLVRVGYLIGRAARAYDIDLGVYAKLAPQERQILLLRRVYLGLVDTDRLGDLVGRGLGAIVPEGLRSSADEEPEPPPAPKVAKRPKTAPPARPAAAGGKRVRKGSAD